jgi:hypothetical protein
MVYKKKITIWPQAAKPNLAHAAYDEYPSWRQQSHATYCEKQLKIT